MPSTFELIVVALGGASGSLIRYLLTLVSLRFSGGSTLAGTFIANLAGCFAIGLLFAVVTNHPSWLSPSTATGLRAGLLGGLTTFSTFAFEAAWLGNAGRIGLMSAYLIGSVGFGMLAVYAGIWAASTNQGTPS